MLQPTLRTATQQEIEAALEKCECVCPTCDRHFAPVRHWQVFCSEKCRKMFHGARALIARLETQHDLEVKELQDKIVALEGRIRELEKGQ